MTLWSVAGLRQHRNHLCANFIGLRANSSQDPSEASASATLVAASVIAATDRAVCCNRSCHQARRWYALLLTLLLWLLGSLWLAQQWQLAELPARHAKVRLAELAPLTQLLAAVAANDVDKVCQLLVSGAPLNLAKPGEGSALMVAGASSYRRWRLCCCRLVLIRT